MFLEYTLIVQWYCSISICLSVNEPMKCDYLLLVLCNDIHWRDLPCMRHCTNQMRPGLCKHTPHAGRPEARHWSTVRSCSALIQTRWVSALDSMPVSLAIIEVLLPQFQLGDKYRHCRSPSVLRVKFGYVKSELQQSHFRTASVGQQTSQQNDVSNWRCLRYLRSASYFQNRSVHYVTRITIGHQN